jgi:hypothetical protein
VGFGLFTTDTPDRSLKAIDRGELDDVLAEVKTTQRALYRSIAAMSRDEKIACGAYVYFTFPKPLAEEAGVADQLDWTVPRDTLKPLETIGKLYDLISPLTGGAEGMPPEEQYYLPIPG